MNENIKNKVLEIMALAVDFNTVPSKKGNKPSIYVTFFGRSCLLRIEISMNGFNGEVSKRGFEVKICENSAEEILNCIIKSLKGIISEWENKNWGIKNENA